MKNMTDAVHTFREWLTLITLVISLGVLIVAGRAIGKLEAVVENTSHSLELHVAESNRTHEKIADILRIHEARTARLEGLTDR